MPNIQFFLFFENFEKRLNAPWRVTCQVVRVDLERRPKTLVERSQSGQTQSFGRLGRNQLDLISCGQELDHGRFGCDWTVRGLWRNEVVVT